MKATVLGASGFIGRHLAETLRARGAQCWMPERGDPEIYKRSLGCVYYCIGLTADFRTRPYDTVDAHVGVLRQVLERADFDSLVYLSSTRVYQGCTVASEEQPLLVMPHQPDNLYNISKLMGESLALASGRGCIVARLSNVVGSDMGATNFLGNLVAESLRSDAVTFQTGLSSEKDYVWIDDAVEGLIAVGSKGKNPIYNIACGKNVSNREIAALLSKKGVCINVGSNAPVAAFPPILINRLVLDTGFEPKPVLPQISAWLDALFDDKLYRKSSQK